MKDIEKVRSAIKASAAELFERFGYDKTTLEDIALKAHRAKTSVYYHFGGKIDVLKANLEDEFNTLMEQLQAIRNEHENEILPQFMAYLKARMELITNTHLYRRFAFDTLVGRGEVAHVVQGQRARFDQWEAAYFTGICSLAVEKGVFSQAVKPATFGDMMTMLLKGLEFQLFQTSDPEASKATYNEVLERLLNGLCKKTTDEMKTKVLSAILIISAVLCSCRKEGTAIFEGNYSFKTSGVVYARQTAEPADTLLPFELTVKLPTESGQMDITPVGDDAEAMIVSMNVIGGDLLLLHATVEGEELVIAPDKRTVSFSVPGGAEDDFVSSTVVKADLELTGEGHRYDNIIIFGFRYEGSFAIGDTEYEIYDSDIDCRAKLNE